MFSLMSFLLENNSIWFNTLIGIIIIYLVYYVRNVVSYPRGPFPLPILGNVLEFRGDLKDKKAEPILKKLSSWTKKYGPIYTIWAGNTPIIMVNSFDLNNEASVVRRNDFIERPDSILHDIFRCGTYNIISTNGPHWEALRIVGLIAIRKFAISEKLPEITNELVDEAVEAMAKEKHLNPILYINFIIYNIISMTAFSERMAPINDKIFIEANKGGEEFQELTGNGFISDYIRWLRPFYYRRELCIKNQVKWYMAATKNKFLEHKKNFTPGVIRDFADCVLEAKEEAIRENFQRKDYLNDDTLFMVVNDLFSAGTETTQITTRWALLILANDPSLQEKIFEEIHNNIGDRFPTQNNKNILPLTYAFLLEVLRHRQPSPVGLDHMSGVDTELGGHKIPKNTTVFFNLYEQNHDPKYWTNPEKFDPNRFLDSNGKVRSGRLPSYVTFGLGRRGCPGEKLALNNLFLIITRLVQRMKIELTTGEGTADFTMLNTLISSIPRDYEIVCRLR